MKVLNPYLNFEGHTREVLDFYQRCFGGEIVEIMTFADAKMGTPPELDGQIMHAEFKAEGIHFMASDCMPGQKLTQGNSISLCINFSDTAEQEKIFNALAAGGTVSHALADSFWGSKFGMLTDRFGVHWLLNCQLQ